MSHRGPVTAVLTAVLGAALGGLLAWQLYRKQKKRLPFNQKATKPLEAPVENHVAPCLENHVTGSLENHVAPCLENHVTPCLENQPRSCLENHVTDSLENQPQSCLENHVTGSLENHVTPCLENHVTDGLENHPRSCLENHVTPCLENHVTDGLENHPRSCLENQPQSCLENHVTDSLENHPRSCLENHVTDSLENQPRAEPPPPAVHMLSSQQLLGVKPVMVSSEDEWQRLWPLIQEELSVFPVLGLDCEWVSAKGKSSSVSLLQMSSYSGLCVLVRLLGFWSGPHAFPPSLRDVLRDPRVFKVGVGCYEDGKRLTRDYGLSLSCTVDLRNLALRQRQASLENGLSLKSLAADLLNVSLDKSLELRCSDWEAEQLSPEQVSYAARDAQVSIALFLHLLGLGPGASGGSSYCQLASRCQGLVDVPFRARGDGADANRRRGTRQSPLQELPGSADLQTADPRKNSKRKPLGVGYSARKSPLYDNCFLHAPDGQPLCTCDKKKAKWYLDKGIGVLKSEQPFVVQLLFEPSGRPDSQQDYYLTAKENLCVVCGKVDSYIRKNIVPHEYRRHFPTEMKDHNSHDILLLCTACHAASNVHDGFLKQQLAQEFCAPQGCEDGVRLLEDGDRRRVRSAARALLGAGDGLPDQRRRELQGLIRDFLDLDQDQDLSAHTLEQAAELETRIFNEAYVPHGLKVVRAHAHRGLQGLMELERRWRQHFLSTMQPHHLPPLWSVDHNHSKFLRKYGENLPIVLH